jgi:uncharacterized protein YjdB
VAFGRWFDSCKLWRLMRFSQLKSRLVAALIVAALSCKSDSLEPDGGSVASVVVTPNKATVAVGANVTLTAEVLDASGKAIKGRKIAWATADPATATVSGAGVVNGMKVGTVQIAASAEGKSAIAEITVNPTPVASVRLSPTSRDLQVGQTVQLAADALDAQGNVLANRPVTFTSSNATVASVDNTGLVTALAPGSAIITGASEGKTAVATVTVSSVPVASVAVTPGTSELVVGQTAQLKAEPRDASGQPLTNRALTWSTSAPNVASVSSTGLVTAVAAGNATITAASEGKSGTAAITVNPKPVSAVIVSPGQASVTAGQTLQLSAQVTDDQGNVLTGRPVTFTSGSPAVATVSASGLVTGVAPGTSTITATSGDKNGTATITVTPVPVATVVISPDQPNVTVGQSVQLSATAKAANGQELTGRNVAWTSGAPSVASVSSTGSVIGLAAGTAVIFASIDGVTGTTLVTVRQVSVATVTVTPPSATVAVGATVQLAVSVKDASGAELTNRLVGWSSSDEAVAVVSSTGRVTGIKTGSATFTASSEGKSGTSTITVTGAPVASVTVTPSTATVIVGQTTPLQAKTLDDKGAELTGRVITWSTSSAATATVSPTGVVTGVAPGTATITATSEGKTGTSTITVNPVPVASVTVLPTSVSLTTGQTQQVTATPKDAQGNALTGRIVTWTTANANVATVSVAGLITATGVGSTTVTATSEGKTATVAVTVVAAPAASVEVTPTSATVSVAFTTQLSAKVIDVNGLTINGASVAWATSAPTIAVVSQTGLVTGLLPGLATITATSGGKSGTAAITVQLAPVATVTVSPASLTLRRDRDKTGQLSATLKDALGNILTGRTVAWSSSATQIASVDQSGLVTAVNKGNAIITAASEGKSGTATVQVQN